MDISRREIMRRLAICWICRNHPRYLLVEARTALCAIATNPTAANFDSAAVLVAFLECWFRRITRSFHERMYIELSTAGRETPVYPSPLMDYVRDRLATRDAVRMVLTDFLNEVNIISTGPGLIVLGYFEPLTHTQMLNLM